MTKKEDTIDGNDSREIACLGKRGLKVQGCYNSEFLWSQDYHFSRFSAGISVRLEEVSGSKEKIELEATIKAKITYPSLIQCVYAIIYMYVCNTHTHTHMFRKSLSS